MKSTTLLTAKQVSELTGLNISTLYDYLKDGRIPTSCVVRIGRSVRIKEKEFQKFLKNGGNKKS
jgi:excisionase family DNA binding protein